MKDFCMLRDEDHLYGLAPGEYRAWAYRGDPDLLFETRVLVIEDPYQDEDGKQFAPDVYVREDGKFINISLRSSPVEIYAVQKIEGAP